MSSSRQEVFDSDDDGDELSPLSSPLASPQLSPLPLHEEPSQLELVELSEQPEPSERPTMPLSTNPADASTSTDPSFFRDVYEEQQRALGAQLDATTNEYDNHDNQVAAAVVVERDPWEVPSSPIEVAGQQRGSYLKRKPDEGRQRTNNASVVVQLDDTSSGGGTAGEPATKQRRTTLDDSSMERQGMGLEISIPLEPLTPSRMHQYPQLLSSSIDNSLAIPQDESLPQIQAALVHQEPYDETIPADAATQSTIAFTTPSIYASSDRRAVGSSSNNTNPRQMKSSYEMDVIQEDGTIAVSSATPQRAPTNTTDLVQMMSSPDIFAEPASMQKPPRPQNLVIEERDEDEMDDDDEEEDELGAHSPRREKKAARSTPRQPQFRSSVEDELSISIDIPVQDNTAHEIGESDAPYDSPPKKAVPKPRSKLTKTKTTIIAASDDDDDSGGGIFDDIALPPPPVDSESDFSDAKTKVKSNAKSKKAQKKKVTVAESVLQKPKRSRGRPKKTILDEEEEEAPKVDPVDDHEAVVRIKLPEAEQDTEAVQAPTKGKRGRKPGKKGKGGGTNSNAEETPTEVVIDETALSTTSGNTSLPGSFKGQVNGEENAEAKDEEKAEETKKEQPLPSDSKPAPAPTGLSSGLLSTGLNTTNMGRVPYRVGLSKKFRIAPLLKVIRK
ncbi:hypothetical protein SBRCBS47491_005265 [Sporothrix bragantina]|uniref:AT hook domain-containing protein n=1 Tax=Sporothrix bragantina TaxID=671064 RepID=A0ABP0BVB2_9PEZI